MRHTNQKGFTEVLFTLIMVAALVGLLVAIISAAPSHTKHHKVKAEVAQLKPVCNGTACTGTYVYEQENKWWYYTFKFVEAVADMDEPYSAFGNNLPPGGTWSTGPAPTEEAVEEEENETEMDVAETDDGSPDSAADGGSDGGSSDGGSGGGDGGGGDGGGGDGD